MIALNISKIFTEKQSNINILITIQQTNPSNFSLRLYLEYEIIQKDVRHLYETKFVLIYF